MVSEECRYFPYRAAFDFKCYFDKEIANQEKDTERLTYRTWRSISMHTASHDYSQIIYSSCY